MADQNKLTHASDLSVGLTTKWNLLGENVGVHASHDLDQLFEAFIDSPAHYKNLISPDFSQVGVGVFSSDDGKIWATQRFLSSPEAPVDPPPQPPAPPATTEPPQPAPTAPTTQLPPTTLLPPPTQPAPAPTQPAPTSTTLVPPPAETTVPSPPPKPQPKKSTAKPAVLKATIKELAEAGI